MKFEAVRQEIDGTIARQMRWVLWENKETSKEVLNRIGSFAGLCYECINRGSVRQGLPILDGEHDQHEENDWALTAGEIFLSGLLSQDNLQSLIDLKEDEKGQSKIQFPGTTLAHLNERDAFDVFSEEH